ncbi:MAG TPA: shikimate dehydrogenase [Acidimicrobiales bacterium]|nr:shikimate dehydrogenase [Acidimicrobiales bacterium]
MGTWPAATTAVAGVIGDPIEHSLSPVLHNAALVELGLDWAYVAFPVPAGRGQEAVAGMGALGIRGLSVTMPHKAAAAAACHELTPVASRLGVANTVTNAGGRLLGDSTDGLGFLDSLAELGWSPRGRSCLVLGAGGAARAVVLALAEAGARRVEVVARQPAQASVAAALAGGAGVVGSVDALESVQDAELVVNATPVGMDGMSLESVEPVEAGGRGGRGRRDRGTLGYDRHNGLPFGLDEKWLGPGQLVADLIYAPSVTPLLAAARYRGAGTCNGLGMLIHQAARQVRAWTGRDAPVEVMSAAALRELRKRAGPGEARGPSSTSAAKLPK